MHGNEQMIEEIKAFLDEASDVQLMYLHKYALKLKANNIQVPKYLQVKEPKIKIIKDWWTKLLPDVVANIETTIQQLDNHKDISKARINRLHPSLFDNLIWSEAAITSLEAILEQYETDFKNIGQLINYTQASLELIQSQPLLGEISINKQGVRMIKIIRRIILIYRYSEEKNSLELIQFVQC